MNTHAPDPRRVLVAEDDPDLRWLIAAALRSDGYQVFEAHDGTELRDCLSYWFKYRWPRESLDLIVSDERMPGSNGIEVVAGLRREHRKTPVIIVTAYADSRLRSQADHLEVRAVFAKPFEIDDLRTLVASILQS